MIPNQVAVVLLLLLTLVCIALSGCSSVPMTRNPVMQERWTATGHVLAEDVSEWPKVDLPPCLDVQCY